MNSGLAGHVAHDINVKKGSFKYSRLSVDVAWMVDMVIFRTKLPHQPHTHLREFHELATKIS